MIPFGCMHVAKKMKYGILEHWWKQDLHYVQKRLSAIASFIGGEAG